MRSWIKNIGPGFLISAAFIGPGTVTVCTVAGVNFGYGLLWALLLSIIACISLQEMAARLGIISQKGLSESIRDQIDHPLVRILAIILILSAIVIGNAAYEAGNISGAVLGITAVATPLSIDFLGFSFNLWAVLIGIVAFLLLSINSYKVLERVFITLVMLMSVSFLITAIITEPDFFEILKGIFIPTTSNKGIFTVIALVGTTVVPYNLFLHAALVSEKWKTPSELKFARKELVAAIVLGGVVSMSIVICGAAPQLVNVNSGADLALGLKPLYGQYATWFMALGLFSAGITSAVTAPLAAAYVVKGCFGWNCGLRSFKFRAVWASILIIGVFVSSLKLRPVDVINFAQIANGILLPIVAIFLFWIVNRTSVMGKYKNTLWQNLWGIIIIGITIFLGAKTIYSVFNAI